MPADLHAVAPQHPARETPPDEEFDSLHVVAWPDRVMDCLGHDPRSWYVEHFWLPLIGPTGTWLLRRIASGLDRSPEGFHMHLGDTALALGIGARRGRHSPIRRALFRCVKFELATRWGDLFAVRRRIPPLARRHLLRLPASVQELHDAWSDEQRNAKSFSEHRRRARQLAVELFGNGEDLDTVELQLWRQGVHPSLAAEACRWARHLGPTDRACEPDEVVTARSPLRNTLFTCSS